GPIDLPFGHLTLLSQLLRPTIPTRFPYTTLFRSIKPEYASEPEVMEMAGQLKAQAQSGRMSMREYDYYLKQMGEYIEVEKPSFRSEEHTSELQSRENLVCRLLLEKKK